MTRPVEASGERRRQSSVPVLFWDIDGTLLMTGGAGMYAWNDAVKELTGRDFDLILFGSESTDARMSVIPAMVAERLDLAQVTFAQKVEVVGTTLTAQRVTDYGFDTLSASLPAVVSVVEKINEPRYPSFKGIMAAKKKPVDILSVTDLGLENAVVGAGAAWSVVADFADRPPKAAGVVVTDDGAGGTAIADYLTSSKFI